MCARSQRKGKQDDVRDFGKVGNGGERSLTALAAARDYELRTIGY
jgi:hypothetical protein